MSGIEKSPALEDWIGRTATERDTLDPRPANLMQSILPVGGELATGDALPPLWNWLYFHSPQPLDALGRDGHPKKGGFLPPVRLPRRMWAGGRFEFADDLRIGDDILKQSRILNVATKSGRTGALCFVTVEHRYVRDDQTIWREEHDIVYREDPAPDQPLPAPVPAPQDFTDRETITPSIVMLFRYSALTFNGHRIHYDREYARNVEGYPDLVFHGPLTATFLAEFARRRSSGRMSTFKYRAVSPLFDTASFGIFLNREDGHTTAWACRPDGHLAMRAEATFE
ncbi:FAS1-like dehydratase domain-containing protein [Tropicimonas marinistellae]|uniref:FAS1-like dehydratase domain-containing protein n=1 Tax=Tropicimonas marinistellae TaxID=1739787 RepID=UPI000836FDF4|nr:MaoC family dehydratase N-terminal domain-containing protein [Tropicimonas marinistellae]